MSDNPDDEFDPLSAGDDAERIREAPSLPWPVILICTALAIGAFVTWLLL
ncbi:MAG: hypothetical protein ACYCW6_31770 [Candidatus Xenobia bacterium]